MSSFAFRDQCYIATMVLVISSLLLSFHASALNFAELYVISVIEFDHQEAEFDEFESIPTEKQELGVLYVVPNTSRIGNFHEVNLTIFPNKPIRNNLHLSGDTPLMGHMMNHVNALRDMETVFPVNYYVRHSGNYTLVLQPPAMRERISFDFSIFQPDPQNLKTLFLSPKHHSSINTRVKLIMPFPFLVVSEGETEPHIGPCQFPEIDITHSKFHSPSRIVQTGSIQTFEEPYNPLIPPKLNPALSTARHYTSRFVNIEYLADSGKTYWEKIIFYGYTHENYPDYQLIFEHPNGSQTKKISEKLAALKAAMTEVENIEEPDDDSSSTTSSDSASDDDSSSTTSSDSESDEGIVMDDSPQSFWPTHSDRAILSPMEILIREHSALHITTPF